jgi:Tfp pilus assembly protein PilF
MLANWGVAPPAEAYKKAKAAASKALELNDQLAEAHTSLAYVTLLYDWDWAAAEDRFKQAIALDPNYASAHHFYSILLMAAGRQPEALVEIKRAQELDPLSLIVNDVVGWIHYQGREYDLAIQQFRNTLEMDPNYVPVLLDLGTAYMKTGDYRSATAEFEKARTVGGESGLVLSKLAQAHLLSGNRKEGVKLLRRIQSTSAPALASPWELSFVYVALGEKQKALALLKQATDERVGWVIRLAVDPAFDDLRSEPEFQALLQRVRVPTSALSR